MASEKHDSPVEQPQRDVANIFNGGPTKLNAKSSWWWSKNKAVTVSTALIVAALAVGASSAAATTAATQADNKTTSTLGENDTTTTNAATTPLELNSTLSAFGQQALVPYKSCDALTSDLTAAIERLVNITIESNIQMRYHSSQADSDLWWRMCEQLTMERSNSANNYIPRSSPLQTWASAHVTKFGTDDRDKPDVVKSNGVFVFAVYGSEIVVVDPSNTTLLSRTTIPSVNMTTMYPDVNFSALNYSCVNMVGESHPFYRYLSATNLLLTSDRLVVITYQSCNLPRNSILSDTGATAVFVYDISTVPTNGKAPLTLLSQSTIKGYYRAARSVDSIAYVFTTNAIGTGRVVSNIDTEICRMELTQNGFLSESEYRNQTLTIATNTIPTFVKQLVGELQNAAGATSCDKFLPLTLLQTSDTNSAAADRPLSFYGGYDLGSLTMVTSFNVSEATSSGDLIKSMTGMFYPPDFSLIYSNAKRLIVAGRGWNQRSSGDWRQETYLMAFRLEGGTIQADAVGQVPGSLINEFSWDTTRQNGVDYLRVVTTSSNSYWNQTYQTSNQLFVLQFPADGAESRVLTVAGIISNISVSAFIHSVRFFGDNAFISTVKDTDPFLTVDLSVPSAPKLVGKLPVPGVTTYLQPVGNGTQILTVGSGLQISLFDVSNFSNPTLLQVYKVPASYSFGGLASEAMYDYQPFHYLEKPKLLLIPVAKFSYNSHDSFDSFVVYHIDPTAGITANFTIEHANNYDIHHGCLNSAYLSARSLVFSGDVLTLKGHTVKNHNLDTHRLLGSVLDLDKHLNRSSCNSYAFPS